MKWTAVRLATAFSVVWLGGCGTVRNLGSEDCVPYGGVSSNVAHFGKLMEGPTGVGHGYVPVLCETLWAGVVCCTLLDTPLSVVADTLTLPWTVAASLARPVTPASTTDTSVSQ